MNPKLEIAFEDRLIPPRRVYFMRPVREVRRLALLAPVLFAAARPGTIRTTKVR